MSTVRITFGGQAAGFCSRPGSVCTSLFPVGHRVGAGGSAEAAGPGRALGAGGRPASSRAALPREHRSAQEM